MTHSATRVSDVSAEYRANNLEIDVPAGYKRTEIGLIPYEWTICELGELGQTLSGGTPRMSDRRFWHGSIPWVSSKDMKVLNIDDSIDHVTPLAIGNGTRIVEPGTILILVRGMTLAHSLPVGIVRRRLAFNQDLKAFVCVPGVHREFLLRWLEANESKILLLTTESTHGTKRLPTEDLLGCLVALPSVEEQRAIAEALSDVDNLLESLDRLIAKKRAVKQAAMQQLLPGKTRLPGYCGEWSTLRLGEIALFAKGTGLAKTDLAEDGTRRCIHYGELFTYYGERINKIRHGTDRSGTFFYSINNDVLMPTSDVTPNGLATASCIYKSGVILGGDILVIRANEQVLNGEFLAYAIRVHRTRVMQLVSGTTVFHLYGRDMAQFTFSAPDIAEQTAIVNVLSDVDEEIAVLERRRDKIRELKQGMMQQLLTGRTRLIKSTVSGTL